MNGATGLLNKHLVPALTALSENTYLSAIRAGMVSVVPLTIIGGLFMIVSYLPITGWDEMVAPYLPLLQIPVTATFGLLSVFACFAIGYDLGKQFKQEAVVSAAMATVIFLMIQIKLSDQTFTMDNLGSKGLFTAILIALVSVRVQKFFTDKNFVIKLPANVPPIVYESFLSLSPLFFLVVNVGQAARIFPSGETSFLFGQNYAAFQLPSSLLAAASFGSASRPSSSRISSTMGSAAARTLNERAASNERPRMEARIKSTGLRLIRGR